jgi:hypothetical protein
LQIAVKFSFYSAILEIGVHVQVKV